MVRKILLMGMAMTFGSALSAQNSCANDVIAPTVHTQNIQVQLDANGLAQISPSQVDNGSFDNCGIDTLFLDKTLFTCVDLGINTVTLTARDKGGTSSGSSGVDTIVLNKLNGSQRTIMASGDINGDGLTDVLLSNLLYVQIRPFVFRSYNLNANGGQNGGVMGDIDGDGVDELINGVQVYDWDFTSNRLVGKQVFPVAPVFRKPVLVDMDGDGHLDYYRPTYYGYDEELWINDGTGNFTLGWKKRVGSYQMTSAAGDLDHDGDNDLVVAGYYDIYVAINDGTGNVTYQSIYQNGGNYINELAVVDLDNDGNQDIVVRSVLKGIFWLQGDGQGNFSNANFIGASSTGGFMMEAVDIDGDGDIDLVDQVNYLDEVILLTNDGQANFTSSILYKNPNPYRYNSVIVADLNNDGVLDVAGSQWGPSFIVTRTAGNAVANEASALAQVEVLPAALNVSASYSGQITSAGTDGQSIYLGYGPQSVRLNAQANKSGSLSYQWSPATGLDNVSAASPMASPQQTTSYTVTVTDAQGCAKGSATVTVNVIDVRCGKKGDKVELCHNGKSICVSKNAVASHLAHANHKKGTCSLGPCVVNAKNSNAIATDFDYHVYPNPSKGVFTFQIHSDNATDAQIIITDLQGRVITIKEETTAVGATEYQFDISDYAAGVYLMNVITPEQRFTERIIKK